MASLRHERFTSLAQANTAIAAKLTRLNNRPSAKLDGTRKILFDQLDRPAMRPLPASRYEFVTWKTAKVNIDYHLDVDRHYYSVLHGFVSRGPGKPPYQTTSNAQAILGAGDAPARRAHRRCRRRHPAG